MENEILLFDGHSARPLPVRALLLSGRLQLQGESEGPATEWPLKGAHLNEVSDHLLLYPAGGSTAYLQMHRANPAAAELKAALEGANPNAFNRLMRQRLPVLLLLVLALSAGLYFGLITLIPFIGSRVISRAQEVQIGNGLHEVLMKEEDGLKKVDTAGTARLQAFGNALKLSDHYPIRLTFINDETVNAYALPGGHIVVYSGILKKIESPEALAALLGHEASHVNERHTLRSLLRSAAHGIVASIIFSDASGITASVVSNAETVGGLHYSRSLEREADSKGMELLLRNGLPADGMQQLMTILEKETKMPRSLEFLSSHPLSEDRVKAARRFARQHQEAGEVPAELKRLFRELKAAAKS